MGELEVNAGVEAREMPGGYVGIRVWAGIRGAQGAPDWHRSTATLPMAAGQDLCRAAQVAQLAATHQEAGALMDTAVARIAVHGRTRGLPGRHYPPQPSVATWWVEVVSRGYQQEVIDLLTLQLVG